MSLRLERISVRYGSVVALEDATLEVADGERLAVLGPSGSGKSTLLRVVAGLERPASGSVSWAGRDLAAVPAHARGFGLMFQDYALFPHRDVAANVAFGLQMRGDPGPAIKRRVDEVLELVGLRGYEARRTTELSGGEQQRVALARALAPQPKLLMLDEPLGALDRGLRERLLGDLDVLFRSLRLTVVYVTHDQEEALAMGDRVAILRAGRLEAVGQPAALWQRPPTRWVASFLGLRNFLPANVSDGAADTPWGTVPVPSALPAGPVQLLLRPEALQPTADGALRGIVRSSTFRGSLTVVRVALGSEADRGPVLDVHLPAGTPPPQAGRLLRLAVAADGVVVLPAEDVPASGENRGAVPAAADGSSPAGDDSASLGP